MLNIFMAFDAQYLEVELAENTTSINYFCGSAFFPLQRRNYMT